MSAGGNARNAAFNRELVEHQQRTTDELVEMRKDLDDLRRMVVAMAGNPSLRSLDSVS
jgi:hypothetical protein